MEQARKEVQDREAWRKKNRQYKAALAAMRALAVKTERRNGEGGDYGVRCTFADGSVLLSYEGEYGDGSFSLLDWSPPAKYKEEGCTAII